MPTGYKRPLKFLRIPRPKIVAQFQRSKDHAPIELRLTSVCCGEIHRVPITLSLPTKYRLANQPPYSHRCPPLPSTSIQLSIYINWTYYNANGILKALKIPKDFQPCPACPEFIEGSLSKGPKTTLYKSISTNARTTFEYVTLHSLRAISH